MIKIILIVGASGVGKDTLIRAAQNDIKANFITRYITRKPDNNELNYYIGKEDFFYLKKSDFFISSWEAHGNIYGISRLSIKNGLNIISISRKAIKDFENIFEDVTTIEIGIPKEMLFERLRARGRESKEAILERIRRSQQSIEAKNRIYFDNSKPFEESLSAFLELLKNLM